MDLPWGFVPGNGEQEEARKAFLKTKPRETPDDGPFSTELKLTKKPRIPYDGVTGTVRLIVEFRSDGKIGFVFPIQTVFGLTDVCIAAANQIQFTPAVANGLPATVVRSVEYSVNLY